MTARQTLDAHDVTDLIGLRVIVHGAAVQVECVDGETDIVIPEMRELEFAAAVARCLAPIRLRGWELRAIRKIAGWTAADLAAKMGEKTHAETISRWENEKQPMGGYAEKVFRLVVCEDLKERAPAISYSGEAIAKLVVQDPWRVDIEFEVPHIRFERVRLRVSNNPTTLAWEVEEPKLAA